MKHLLLGCRSRLRAAAAALLCTAFLALPMPASAQYFGRNKVQFDKFKFEVLATQHFDVYYYPSEESAARVAGRMAERWYARLSRLLGHDLTGRQPLILYASHPHFAQTNVVESLIGEGTGGVTEGMRRRITLPLGASLAESDHVIGHELVHAFQYDMLGPAVETVPLWFIEGMAEYLSIGPRDPQTAMWLRDAALESKLPSVGDLDDPDYFPYRWGQAFWAYLSGRYGDDVVTNALHGIANPAGGGRIDAIDAIEQVTGADKNALTSSWHAAIREMYGVSGARGANRDPRETGPGKLLIGGDKRATMNVGPALSPDGSRLAFLSERDMFSVDLYLADATTGKVIRKLISTAVNPHFESLQFLMSAGTWNPSGRELAVATIRDARPVIAIVDTDSGRVSREIPFESLDEIFQPAWSPDGRRLAFSGQAGGFTDLYVYDFQSGATTKLTNDEFADLQPAWSPDSQSVVFVTDRFTTDPNGLRYGRYGLATVTPGTSDVRAMNVDLAGNAINPQWLADGSIAFLSDATGRPEAYVFDRRNGRLARIAVADTGLAGITPLSPALSVAATSGRIAYSVFRDRGFDIRVQDATDVRPTPPATGPDLAQLPPPSRQSSTISRMIGDASSGLVPASGFTAGPYKPKLSLVDVGQQIGVSTGGPFGSYASGGIALTFSDILGNRLLGTSIGVNGGFSDISAQAIYVNRGSRWNWGVFGDRVPYLSGSVGSGFVNQNGQTLFVEEVDRIRQTYQQVGFMTAYPFSSATRIEFAAAAQHIGFTREIQTVVSDPFSGAILSDETTKLPSPGAIRLYGPSAALVHDTAISGPTGPLVGQRFHMDVEPTFGDLRFTSVTADFRQYFMPIKPVTIAGRLMHVGRYGGSSEDDRLFPLFLGYPELVRGYNINSFDAQECAADSCPVFDRLIGSRVAVINLEVRAPLVGLFRGRLDYGAVPVDVFGFFDGGVAWVRGQTPRFTGGQSDWVRSVGGGLRMNLLGFAIGELTMVRPLDRPSRGWMFVFNLRQGF